MTITQPSFASVLHRMSQCEPVEGAELLALPGVRDLPTAYPICEPIDYELGELPELVAHVGRLAASVNPEAEQVARIIAEELVDHMEQHGCIIAVLPDLRALLWQLGLDADLATKLPN